MRVLVTDSDTRPALAAVRALGHRGYEVFSAGARHPSLASVSRFSAAFDRYPNPLEDSQSFVEAIVEIARRRRIDVLLPITEVTTLLAAEHRARLPATTKLALAEHDAIAKASDKAHVIDLARELGVPVPSTVVVDHAADAAAKTAGLPYPVVVKPARSRVRLGNGWVSTGVSYANDANELAKTLDALRPELFPVLLQERIHGPGVGVFACFDRDRYVGLFSHQRLREKPPSGGVSVLCQSAPLDASGVEYAARLLARLNWRGVAMVEFKRDLRDGSLRLMEINGRFWGSLQLAIDAGVDFPSLAVDLALGKELPPPSAYTIGLKSRWLAGDSDALFMRLFRSRGRLSLPADYPSRWRYLREYLDFSASDVRLEIERRDDPAPARLEWRRWLSSLAQRS
jgi:predicted ATP-grasp superfamily ATP-dependent carboligase